jgi:hypothetical protein
MPRARRLLAGSHLRQDVRPLATQLLLTTSETMGSELLRPGSTNQTKDAVLDSQHSLLQTQRRLQLRPAKAHPGSKQKCLPLARMLCHFGTN